MKAYRLGISMLTSFLVNETVSDQTPDLITPYLWLIVPFKPLRKQLFRLERDIIPHHILGEVGEICFRCDQIMQGYYGDAEATSKAIDEQGWLHWDTPIERRL